MSLAAAKNLLQLFHCRIHIGTTMLFAGRHMNFLLAV